MENRHQIVLQEAQTRMNSSPWIVHRWTVLHRPFLMATALHPQTPLVVCGCSYGAHEEQEVLFYSIPMDQVVHVIPVERTVAALAVLPTQDQLIVGYRDGFIELWDMQPAIRRRSTPTYQADGAIKQIISLPQDQGVLLATTDAITRCTPTLEPVAMVAAARDDSIEAIAINLQATQLASGSQAGALVVYDLTHGGLTARPLITQSEAIACLAYDPGGTTIACSLVDAGVILYSAESGLPLRRFDEIAGIATLTYHPHDPILLTGSVYEAPPIRAWSVGTGQSVPLPAQTDWPDTLICAADGMLVVCGGRGYCGATIEIWSYAE